MSTFQWWRGRLKQASDEGSTSIIRLPLSVSAATPTNELVVEVGRFRVIARGTRDREQLGSLLDELENR